MNPNRLKGEPAYFDLAGASAYPGGALQVRTLRRLIAGSGGFSIIAWPWGS
jgi:hypothetical protein